MREQWLYYSCPHVRQYGQATIRQRLKTPVGFTQCHWRKRQTTFPSIVVSSQLISSAFISMQKRLGQYVLQPEPLKPILNGNALANVRNTVFDQNADRVNIIPRMYAHLMLLRWSTTSGSWYKLLPYPSHGSWIQGWLESLRVDSPCFLFSDLITKVRVRVRNCFMPLTKRPEPVTVENDRGGI